MFEWSLDLRGLQRKTCEQGEDCCILCEIFISKLNILFQVCPQCKCPNIDVRARDVENFLHHHEPVEHEDLGDATEKRDAAADQDQPHQPEEDHGVEAVTGEDGEAEHDHVNVVAGPCDLCDYYNLRIKTVEERRTLLSYQNLI